MEERLVSQLAGKLVPKTVEWMVPRKGLYLAFRWAQWKAVVKVVNLDRPMVRNSGKQLAR